MARSILRILVAAEHVAHVSAGDSLWAFSSEGPDLVGRCVAEAVAKHPARWRWRTPRRRWWVSLNPALVPPLTRQYAQGSSSASYGTSPTGAKADISSSSNSVTATGYRTRPKTLGLVERSIPTPQACPEGSPGLAAGGRGGPGSTRAFPTPRRYHGYPRLRAAPSMMCPTVWHASMAFSTDSKMSFQRMTTIGSIPVSNNDARPWRNNRSPSFSRR
jgi:hypothetical protein